MNLFQHEIISFEAQVKTRLCVVHFKSFWFLLHLSMQAKSKKAAAEAAQAAEGSNVDAFVVGGKGQKKKTR